MTIHQDAKLYVSLLNPGEQLQHDIAQGRFGWLQVAKGAVETERDWIEARGRRRHRRSEAGDQSH